MLDLPEDDVWLIMTMIIIFCDYSVQLYELFLTSHTTVNSDTVNGQKDGSEQIRQS